MESRSTFTFTITKGCIKVLIISRQQGSTLKDEKNNYLQKVSCNPPLGKWPPSYGFVEEPFRDRPLSEGLHQGSDMVNIRTK